MGITIMGAAAVSLDGFIADDNDEVGPLFDWLGRATSVGACRAARAIPLPPRSRAGPRNGNSSRWSGFIKLADTPMM
jgi:hypothetical protein